MTAMSEKKPKTKIDSLTAAWPETEIFISKSSIG